MSRWSARDGLFGAVLVLLLGAGWAANHFASMLGVLREQEHLSDVLLNGAYGIYALGLLPSLLGGGALADRLGARAVVLTGGTVAAIGNGSLLIWHGEVGVLLGRFVVGLGVGLAMSAGTAWAGRLRGAGGAILAGIFLTLGFAVGPIVSGLLAFALQDAAAPSVPFAVTTLFSLATVALALVVARRPPTGARGDCGHDNAHPRGWTRRRPRPVSRPPDGTVGVQLRNHDLRGAGESSGRPSRARCAPARPRRARDPRSPAWAPRCWAADSAGGLVLGSSVLFWPRSAWLRPVWARPRPRSGSSSWRASSWAPPTACACSRAWWTSSDSLLLAPAAR